MLSRGFSSEEPRRGIREWIEKGASFSGHERNRLFVQQRSGRKISFSDQSLLSGADVSGDGRVFAKLDMDWDGDVDLVLSNANAPRVQLFENQHNPAAGGAIWVDLRGGARTDAASGASNRDGVGARVVLQTDDGPRSAEKRAGEGFAAQNTSWLHFGLGQAASANGLTVYWPSGKQTVVEGPLEVGVRIRIYEDSSDSPTRSSLERVP
jgi:hypothetical protein